MRTLIKSLLTVAMVLFCFKYLYADAIRFDYCKDTEYYDHTVYTFTGKKITPTKYTINGNEQSLDSIPDYWQGYYLEMSRPTKDMKEIRVISISGALLFQMQ